MHQLGMDFAPFKKPQASAWGFSHTAALFLAFPVKFCFATFHGGPQSTAYPDLRVFFLACTPDENRPIVSECTSLPSKYLTCGQDISQSAPLFLHFPRESCFAIFSGGPIESAGKKQSSGLFLRPRVPRLGARYRGPSICVATFHGSPSGGFLFLLLFFLGYVLVQFPLRGGLIRRSDFFVLNSLKSLLTHCVAAPSPHEILLRNLSWGPLVCVLPWKLYFLICFLRTRIRLAGTLGLNNMTLTYYSSRLRLEVYQNNIIRTYFR